MAKLTPSRFWIDDTPGEFVPGHVIDVRLTRGFGYHTFSLKVREGWRCDEELQQKKNAVTLKFECAAENVTQATSLESEEWYILARRALEWGWVEYTFADQRWHKRHNKLTKQYNVISYGSKYRKDSLYAASRPWTCLEAAEDALTALGFQVVIDPKLPQHLRNVKLPDNLGNSEAAGFFGASLPEFGPLMLEPIRCDPVPTLDGKLMITDRVREQSKDLKGYIHIGGQVREADVHWQKPKKLIVEFEKRIERRWEYSEGQTAARNAVSPAIENVAPRWDADSPDAGGGFIPLGDVGDSANDALIPLLNLRLTFDSPMSLAGIKSFFMAPSLYDTEKGSLTPEQVGKLRIAEGLLRENWRRTFKVKVSQTDTDDIRARWAQPEIGRLQADGTNRPDGAVFMDYVVDLRYPQRKAGEHALQAVFSENISYSTTRPAPFKAEWLDKSELIFQIRENNPTFHKRGYYPGALRGRGKCYAGLTPSGAQVSMQEVIRGRAKLAIDSNVDFTDTFRLTVYWHGLFLGAPLLGGAGYARTHKVEKALFPSGPVDSLTLRCESLTANFGYNGTFPGELLNGTELDDKAREMQRETKAALTQGRAGVMRHGGLDVLAVGGFSVGGDIHEIAILVGQRAAFSIDTHITVLPGARLSPAPVFTREPGRKAEAVL